MVGIDADLFREDIQGKYFAVSIGNNRIRVRIFEELKIRGAIIPKLIHPTAYVSASAQICEGSYIQPNSVIWSLAVIGESVIISPSTVIAHHTSVGKGCLIST